MKYSDVISADFKPEPYWWENYRPTAGSPRDLPAETEVAIVGAGYAGLSCALELRRMGLDCCVLDSSEPGGGASTRNGGCIMGGFRIGKVLNKSPGNDQNERAAQSVHEAYDFLDHLISREDIPCFWEKNGRFVGAWTPEDRMKQARALETLPEGERSNFKVISRAEQRSEVASDFYHGGLLADRSGKLDPALYFKGLLDSAIRMGALVCAYAEVIQIIRSSGGWLLKTNRGNIKAQHIVIATNGYTTSVTQQLRRRLIPIASHVIATEELPAELTSTLLPTGRTVAETQRILCYYRLSGDGRRLIFGGRARFTHVDPLLSAVLVRRMMVRRFPQLDQVRVTHGWSGYVAKTFDALPHMGMMDGMHYVLGCNGSGVAMMTYLGMKTARRIANIEDAKCAFELSDFPTVRFYNGNPKWILPTVGTYYRFRDHISRLKAGD